MSVMKDIDITNIRYYFLMARMAIDLKWHTAATNVVKSLKRIVLL